MEVKTESKQPGSINNFAVFPGNYPQVVRDAFSRRKEKWREVPKDESLQKANFIWKPTNFDIKTYSRINKIMEDTPLTQRKFLINHLENIRGITTKTGLVRSLKQYYKKNSEAIDCGYSVFDTTPTSFVLTSSLDTYEYFQFERRF